MPKRLNTRTVTSERVQGEDSWVTFRRLTLGEAKQAREAIAAAGRAARGAQQSADEITEARANAGWDGTIGMLRDTILEWNWVDDAGAPFPQVREDATVLDRLTDEEVLFLGEAMGGPTKEEEGKSGGRSPAPSSPAPVLPPTSG